MGVPRSNAYRGSVHQAEALVAAISIRRGIPRANGPNPALMIVTPHAFRRSRAAAREESCGGAMHDALMVGEYPGIPIRFQAHKCCDPYCGKDMMKQISNADVQKVQFDVGSRFLGKLQFINRGETARLQPPRQPVPNTSSSSDHTTNAEHPIDFYSKCHRVRQQSSSPAS